MTIKIMKKKMTTTPFTPFFFGLLSFLPVDASQTTKKAYDFQTSKIGKITPLSGHDLCR
jgi:hypothetical protein